MTTHDPENIKEAVRDRYTKELSAAQKARFLARIGSRAIKGEKEND